MGLIVLIYINFRSSLQQWHRSTIKSHCSTIYLSHLTPLYLETQWREVCSPSFCNVRHWEIPDYIQMTLNCNDPLGGVTDMLLVTWQKDVRPMNITVNIRFQVCTRVFAHLQVKLKCKQTFYDKYNPGCTFCMWNVQWVALKRVQF